MELKEILLEALEEYHLRQGIKEGLKELLKAKNERWITIHPHGDDSDDYRRLKIEDGETVKEAIDRVFKKHEENNIEELQKKLKAMWTDLMKKSGGNLKKISSEDKRKYRELSDKIKALKEGKKEETKQKEKEKKSNDIFAKFNELKKQSENAKTQWINIANKVRNEYENSKEYKKLNEEYSEITKKLCEIAVKDRLQYLTVSEQRSIIVKRKQEIREEISQKHKLNEYQDAYLKANEKFKEENKRLITENAKTIKDKLKAISSNHNEIVVQIEKQISTQYDELLKKKEDLRVEYNTVEFQMLEAQYGSKEREELKNKCDEIYKQRQEIDAKIKKNKEENIIKMSKILQVKNGANIKAIVNNSRHEDNLKKLQTFLNGVIPSENFNNQTATIQSATGERASQSGSSLNLHTNEKSTTIIHEYMHYVEETNPERLNNSLAFLTARTEGEKQQSLRKITGARYRTDEVCKPDNFFNPYCGKLYDAFGGKNKQYANATGSEVMSMGIEELFSNPVEFVRKDREYFDFVIANLRGTLWD